MKAEHFTITLLLPPNPNATLRAELQKGRFPTGFAGFPGGLVYRALRLTGFFPAFLLRRCQDPKGRWAGRAGAMKTPSANLFSPLATAILLTWERIRYLFSPCRTAPNTQCVFAVSHAHVDIFHPSVITDAAEAITLKCHSCRFVSRR